MDPAKLNKSVTYALHGYCVSYRGRDEWGRHVFEEGICGGGCPVAWLLEPGVRELISPLVVSETHYYWPWEWTVRERRPPDEPPADEPFIREAG